MIKVKFLGAQEVEDGEGIVYQRFRAGQVVELNNAAARFWLTRGFAEEVVGRAKAPPSWPKIPKPESKKVEADEPKAAEQKVETKAAGKLNPTSPKRGRGRPRSASHPGQV